MPTKEATIEKINLSDCIPFINSDQARRDQYLKQTKEKARAELHKHYLELKCLMSSDFSYLQQDYQMPSLEKVPSTKDILPQITQQYP